MLAFTMVVPAFASDDRVHFQNGHSVTNFAYLLNDSDYPYAFVVYSRESKDYILVLTDHQLVYEKDGVIGRYRFTASFSAREYVGGINGWDFVATSDYNTFEFFEGEELCWANFGIRSDDGSMYFTSYDLDFGSCDGSTCPATDVNADGVCDDCGKVLMLSAPQQYTHTVIFRYADGTFVKSEFTSDTEFTPTGYLADNVYRVDNGKVVSHIMYESFDGLSWEETRNNSVSNQSYNFEDGMTVYQSTFDWYDESGNRFFPVPLWEQVGMVTQGEMGNLTAETAGTMKVLVVCGVGLMACLVVLSLFGKRSLLSLR